MADANAYSIMDGLPGAIDPSMFRTQLRQTGALYGFGPVTADSRDGRTAQSYGVLSNPAPRPGDWAVNSGIAEAISPTMGGYGLGAGLGTTYQAAKSGDYGGALEAGLPLAMAMVPGLKGKPAAAVAEQPKGIRAYHGSPHDFDKFDASKIGTGEGAQAFGHGLYFAENKGVAKSYRDKLSGVRGWDEEQPAMFVDGKIATSSKDIRLLSRTRELGINGAIAAADADALSWRQQAKAKRDGVDPQSMQLSSIYGRPAALDEVATFDALAADSERQAAALRKFVAAGRTVEWKHPKAVPGRLYEVRINAEPDQFLDWDKPLGNQTAPVVNRLQSLPEYNPQSTADKLMMDIMMRDNMPSGAGPNHPQVTEALKAQGIPGIRYLDQGSRGAGEGSRNYVVFDPETIDIMRKYGLLGPMAGGVAAGAMQQPNIMGDQ